jgi:hypothetical protein
MSRRMTAIADLDDDLDIKTMFDGWPEVEMPEPVKPVLSLESAVRVLEAAGYELLDSFEIRGTKNFLCEFGLARAAAPLLTDCDLLAQHIQRVFVEAGFDLRARVVTHKQVFFADKFAHSETAVPGTFRLLPDDYRLPDLEMDYRDMRDMFFEEPPSWSQVVERLRQLESEINGTSAPGMDKRRP